MCCKISAVQRVRWGKRWQRWSMLELTFPHCRQWCFLFVNVNLASQRPHLEIHTAHHSKHHKLQHTHFFILLSGTQVDLATDVCRISSCCNPMTSLVGLRMGPVAPGSLRTSQCSLLRQLLVSGPHPTLQRPRAVFFSRTPALALPNTLRDHDELQTACRLLRIRL